MITKIKYILVFLLLSEILICQPSDRSISIKINAQQTLQSLFDIATEAHILYYSDYVDNWPWYDGDYVFKCTSIEVTFNSITQNIELNIDLDFNYDMGALFDFLFFEGHIASSVSASGIPTVVWDDNINLARLELSDIGIDQANISTDIVDKITQDKVNEYLQDLPSRLGELPSFTLLNTLPQVDPYWVQSEHPEVYLTDTDLIAYVDLNQDLEIANKSESNPGGILPGTMDLINNTTPEVSRAGLQSGSSILARKDEMHHASTHQLSVGGEYHRIWAGNIDYKLNTDEFQLTDYYFTYNLTAWYTTKNQITLENPPNSQTEISDPWWVIDEENRLQSDEYHTTDGATYPVFLNQNQ